MVLIVGWGGGVLVDYWVLVMEGDAMKRVLIDSGASHRSICCKFFLCPRSVHHVTASCQPYY